LQMTPAMAFEHIAMTMLNNHNICVSIPEGSPLGKGKCDLLYHLSKCASSVEAVSRGGRCQGSFVCITC
jgi:hypothetical protein